MPCRGVQTLPSKRSPRRLHRERRKEPTPSVEKRPPTTEGELGRAGDDHWVDLWEARSEHLAPTHAVDALQQGLARALGAVAKRFGWPLPRQGWINAADGNLYRLNFFAFAQGFNDSPKGDTYRLGYTLMTPLSRPVEFITNIPFLLHNNVDAGKRARRRPRSGLLVHEGMVSRLESTQCAHRSVPPTRGSFAT
jgi:hypothetical protein